MSRDAETTKRSVYSSVGDIFSRYWRAYGGLRALLASPYFHCSLVFSALCFPLWSRNGWWDLATDVLPTMMGFSLAAYAMLLSFGDEKFQRLMSRAQVNDTNTFTELSATFVHFVIVQTIGFLLAIMAKAWYVPIPQWFRNFLSANAQIEVLLDVTGLVFWNLGGFFLVYAVATGLAATMRIFRLSDTFARFQAKPTVASSMKDSSGDAAQ